MPTTSLLFAFLRAAMGFTSPAKEETDALPDALSALVSLAHRHDLTHLLAEGMRREGIPLTETLDKSRLMAVYRYAKLEYDLRTVIAALESAGIRHIPLKGCVLRAYYPEPWMRTSCDIDILVQETDLDRAERVLSSIGAVKEKIASHDVSYRTAGEGHLELHFHLIEDHFRGGKTVLKQVFDHAIPKEGCRYQCVMPDAILYYYHIAHMAKHVISGGCGIRPFLDLYLLDQRGDAAARLALLKEGGLATFARVASALARVWFEGAPGDEMTEALADYIIAGGVYGQPGTRIAIAKKRKGGRGKYLWSRLFMPSDQLRYRYPILQRHPILTPFLSVARIVSVLRPSRMSRSLHEWKLSGEAGDGTEAEGLMRALGL